MRIPLTALSLVGFLTSFTLADMLPDKVSFNRHIRPILSNKCFKCHGPAKNARKGDLRLDTQEGAFKDLGKGKFALMAGNLKESQVFHRITATDLDDVMPPVESKMKLETHEIALIIKWIEQGAEWEAHWSFIPPKRPAVPSAKDQWPFNPIDQFVARRLEKEGLKPSQEAQRHTLIRRLSFDLTGLPPSPAEVEAFVTDKEEGAYEHLVDRLLASDRYGERMTLAWMDAARYGDTSVFHADGPRTMWPWRDWVIKAYNTNMPFDQFTIEQLAGDLLPESTVHQKVASGFNRNHGTTDEGGAIDEEYRVEYMVDRVKTTGTIWMGLTLECGQCHDHKYDPLTQKDYYGFYAYFNKSKDRGMQSRGGNAVPLVTIPSEEQESKLKVIKAALPALEAELKEKRPDEKEVDKWIEKQRRLEDPTIVVSDWQMIGPFKAESLQEAFEKKFGPEPAPDLKKKYGENAWTEQKFEDGKPHELKIDNNSAVYLYRTITVNDTIDRGVSLGSDDSITVWLNGEKVLAKNVGRAVAPDQEKVVLTLLEGENQFLMKICNGGGPAGFYFSLGQGLIPPELLAALQIPGGLDPNIKKKFFDHYRTSVWSEGLRIQGEIKRLQEEEKEIASSSVTCMVMDDMEQPRKTYVLMRGQYDSPIENEEILPATPAFLPPPAKDALPNRLGMARWLMQDNHPLTSRVTVNRYWTLLFGNGLVGTVSDFGAQGEPPTHPDLLDWLAVEFRDSGWNVKHMIKLMVMSATYRQSSKVTPDLLERDPDNRLFARAPRFRLQGEFIRDNALAVSGLLVDTIGGPGTRPYQPPGLWNEVSLDGNVRFVVDKGENLYRRGMYIYWKRSAPAPSMRAFDAPTREKCVVQRARTNTPLQALVTLNDIQFVETARAFAERVIKGGGEDFDARLDMAFMLATAHKAGQTSRQVMKEIYEDQLAEYEKDQERAKKLLTVGDSPRDEKLKPHEHAAWTVLTSMILNLDETLNRE